MNQQRTCVLACVAAIALFSPVSADEAASLPNIVLIVADDKYAEAGRQTLIVREIAYYSGTFV